VLAATANVPETVLDGTVARVDGELAEVDTAVGTVRGLHDDAAVGDAVQVRIGADAVTIYKESQRVDPDSTSARNRLRGEVVEIVAGKTVSTVRVEVGEVVFRVDHGGELGTVGLGRGRRRGDPVESDRDAGRQPVCGVGTRVGRSRRRRSCQRK